MKYEPYEPWEEPQWKTEELSGSQRDTKSPTPPNSTAARAQKPPSTAPPPPNPPPPPRRSSTTQDGEIINLIDSDDDDGAAAADDADERRHESGTRVTLCGLKKRPELNGELCEVLSWQRELARYRVRLLPANVDEEAPRYDIKPENLLLAGAGSGRTVHVIGGFFRSKHFANLTDLQTWADAQQARHRVEGVRFRFEEGNPRVSSKEVLHTGHGVKTTLQVESLRRNGHGIFDEVVFWRDVAIADETPPVKAVEARRKRGRISAAADEVTPKRRRSSATSTQTARSTGGGASGGGNRSSVGGSSSHTITDAMRVASLTKYWRNKKESLCAGCHIGVKRPIVGPWGLFVGCSLFQGHAGCKHRVTYNELNEEELDAWHHPS